MLEVVERLAEETVNAASTLLWPLSDTDIRASLLAVHRWEQSVAVFKTRLVRQVEVRNIPAREGHRSMAGWLLANLRTDPHLARELARQASGLRRRPTVEQALLDGLLDMRQAMVIADAVNAIPAALDAMCDDLGTDGFFTDSARVAPGDPADDSPEDPVDGSSVGLADTGAAGPADGAGIAEDAEAALIDMAARFPAYQLRQVGERILAHVAPEIADRVDEAALRRQEARAHPKRSFTLSQQVNGVVHLSGSLDVEAAAIVEAALRPLCVPAPGDDRTPGQKRADALVDVCRLALRTGELPDHGGEPPHVAVTIRFGALARQIGAAVLDNGERVSAATARRMACDARILPIVLGGAGQVLDAGRSRRLATGGLRRALVARDRGCAFPCCDRPPRWCDGHHLRSWSEGGPTNLDNLVLLCRTHHRIMHDPRGGWRVRLGVDRLPEFIPPPWIDLLQRPQHNRYHPRT